MYCSPQNLATGLHHYYYTIIVLMNMRNTGTAKQPKQTLVQ